MRKILSSILTLLTLVTLSIFSANSFAQQVPFANVPFDTTNIPEPVPPPAAVRDFFELDSYYQQWINIRGFPVLASAEVSPYALKEAAWLIYQMIGHRPDVLKIMAERTARFSIVPHNKHTSDMPESNTGRLSFFWDVRHRTAHCRGCPIASTTEENLIGNSSSPIHEFGHLLQDWGLNGIDSTFNNRVIRLYNMAKAEGLYHQRYAGSDQAEYWAEGVASWFHDTNPNQHVALTRSALKKYDPRFAKLMMEVFGDRSWRYTPPATRTHLPHLQGFNPQKAPIYQRPVRLLELEAQLMDPNSDGGGKWVNLKLYPPSQLRRLKASTSIEDRTDFIFGNLTGNDLALYSFDDDGKKTIQYYSTTDDFIALDTHVGAIWLIEDHTGKDLAVFRAEEQVGRVLVGGTPSREVLDVNSDGTVNLLDLTSIASRYGRRGVNPADINKDRVVNIVDVLLVAGSVSALPREAVETFKATKIQQWLTDAKQLDIENEYQQKGVVVLGHLLTEIELPSKSTKVVTDPLKAIFEGHTDIVWSVAISPDSKTIASAGWDKKVRLWDTETKQHKISLILPEAVMSVAFSPDGQTLASGSWDGTIRLWNPQTGKLQRTLTGHTDGIESVVFSPDGQTLASGSADQTIRLWDTHTGKLKKTLTGQERITSIAFSPDGQMLASGSADQTIRLWNPRTGKLQRTLTGHTDWVTRVTFSPDSKTLASGGGSDDRTLRLWNPQTGKLKKMFTGYTDQIRGIAFSPDGQILASSGWDQKIRLWNTETGKYEKALEGHRGGVISVVFSPDERTLASGGKDGKVYQWDVQWLFDERYDAEVETDTPVVAATDAMLSISPASVVSPAIGEQLTLNLNIVGGESVADYQVTLQFDPTALRYVESRNADYLPTGASFVPPVVNRGSIKLASTALTGVSNGDGTLAIVTFEVLTVKPSTLTLSDMLLADSQGNTFLPQVEAGEITEPPKLKGDVTGDGVVNIQDLVLVASSFGQTGENSADINADGVVNIADLVLVAGALGTSAAAPLLYPDSLELLTPADVRHWLAQAQHFGLTDATSQRGILLLEQLLAALIPKDTTLLANYPNPFNPETWIPYQLATPTEVTITIYGVDGQIVRTLTLGHQPAGMYQSRSRAAYWDGRNAFDESVASGVYFYTLTAGDFIATRKMLIRK